MKFPAFFEEIVRQGYTFLCRKRCEQCGRELVIFLSPKKRKPAFVAKKDGRLVSHHAVCAAARVHLKGTR
jgi:hypothetical protein